MAKDQEQFNFSDLNWAPLEFAQNPKSIAPVSVAASALANTEVKSSPEPKAFEADPAEELIAEQAKKKALAAEQTEGKPAPQVLSIYELNKWIKNILEGEFPLVWIKGEISNFKAHTSGHFYFSLKDSKAQITAVMFRGFNQQLKYKPHDGMEVLVRGKVTVYEPRGNYQIFIELMEPVGAGALQKAFEQLKNKLQAEGLFAAERKRALPALPQHIAIVTSPTGAAIRDMLSVLGRRYRGARVTLIAAKVQGDQAPAEVVAGIQAANRLTDVDVLIVGRGGGSIEDLWAFNDERVARAIAASRVPVISAVGHEIDFTIADFVADLRAPTPSAAAELVVQNAEDLQNQIRSDQRNLHSGLMRKLQMLKQKISLLARALVDPVRMLQDMSQRNDDMMIRLELAAGRYLSDHKMKIELLTHRLGTPEGLLNGARVRNENLRARLQAQMQNQLQRRAQGLKAFFSLLDSLSPLRVVARGYSIVTSSGAIVKEVSRLMIDQEIEIQFAKGEALAKISKIISKN